MKVLGIKNGLRNAINSYYLALTHRSSSVVPSGYDMKSDVELSLMSVNELRIHLSNLRHAWIRTLNH